MSPQDFAFWLKGFMEIENPKQLDSRQTQIIKDHLELVFEKQTPNRNEVGIGLDMLPNDFLRNNGTGGSNVYCHTNNNGTLIC